MGIWNPTNYLDENDGDGGACTSWAYVNNFDDDWQDTSFWWNRRFSLTLYNVWWNNGCAIRLLIAKCDSLQAQIDAGVGAVDMDAILNAMLSASFTQLQKFIGIIDAYRVAIWNAPFNAEWYAALARGFEKWP